MNAQLQRDVHAHLSAAAAQTGDADRVHVQVALASRACVLLTGGCTEEQRLAACAIEAAALRAYGHSGQDLVAIHKVALRALMGTLCTPYATARELHDGIGEAVVFQGDGATSQPVHILRCLETIKAHVTVPLEYLLGSEHGLLDWQRNPTQPLHEPVPVRPAALDLLHAVTLTALSVRGNR
ncbi:hypothetical protein [Deinococcus kurensis]|uniref:hypothetical protein n=1 Tax=Deinococcus kurensis TaxID=2662757 RepID=UPI0012D2A568|nr:hypothetical protein [Deinococcus kurensis]